MQTYVNNASNLAISQAYRPQLERFFASDGNIYVVEADAADYEANPPFWIGIVKRNWVINYKTCSLRTSVEQAPLLNLYTADAAADNNTWVYFTGKITFDYTGAGRILVYKNGVSIIDFTGAVAYNDIMPGYCKIGIYHWYAWPTTPIAYTTRDIDVKAFIMTPESENYTVAQIYTDLQAI